jgi:hypothetical protein
MKHAIKVKGTGLQAQFWIRMFKLEDNFEHIHKRLNDELPPGEVASVPIISEYLIDEGLKFYFVLLFRVDRLGPNDVMGMVYLGDKSEWKRIETDCHEFADEVLQMFVEHRHVDEVGIIEVKQEDSGPVPSPHDRH